MSLKNVDTYQVTSKNGFDQTIKGSKIYLNADQIVTLKDLSLNFDPNGDPSTQVAVSKVTFSNSQSLIISQTDASSLK